MHDLLYPATFLLLLVAPYLAATHLTSTHV